MQHGAQNETEKELQGGVRTPGEQERGGATATKRRGEKQPHSEARRGRETAESRAERGREAGGGPRGRNGTTVGGVWKGTRGITIN